ncbi:MAG TPA: hypothetical protein VGO28_03785 [Acidimicrobiia bacterium]
MLLAAFEPASKELAIFYIISVACFVVAAFAGPSVGRRAGGSLGLVAIGLAFFVFPSMWTQVDAAF